MKRNQFETRVAVESASAPVAARVSSARQGPPLAELLAELGYDDIWAPTAEIEPPVPVSAAAC